MIRNHIKIAFRFFLKNKLFTGINVSGLSIGIAAFVLLINYVTYERSYDDYLPNADDIYRVTLTTNLGDKGFQTTATNHPTVGPAMLQDFPEVEDYVRMADKNIALFGTVIFSYTNEQGQKTKLDVRDNHLYFANNSIISMFDIKMLQGDPTSALQDPGSIILSSDMANRFFGNESPVGKSISINDGSFSLKVSGVFEEGPRNTHLPLSMIVSYSTFGRNNDFTNSWIWGEFYNYVKLKPGTNPNEVEARLPAFVKKHMGDITDTYGFEARFGLQPVRDIHLKSDLIKEISPNNTNTTLYFLVIVAAFIIGIAVINFINLSTAKAIERAKEVGIKKVIGAHRSMLIRQFLLESIVINLLSIVISIGLVSIFIPPFNSLVGQQVLQYGMWSSPATWFTMIAILVFSGLLAGLYPALVLSGFIPAQILKGNFQNVGHGLVLRKALVIVQFAIAIALVAGTYVVFSQFSYMQNKKLGFKKDHTMVITAPTYTDDIHQVVETFKEELLQHPGIKNVTLSREIPGKKIEWHNSIRRSFENIEEASESGQFRVDHDYFETYNIPILAGRNFRREDATDYYDDNGPINTGHKVIINQTAAKRLGFQTPEEAIGELVIFKYGVSDRTAQVVGVAGDYHQQSLQFGFEPILFNYFEGYDAVQYLSLSISGNVGETIGMIKERFEGLFPNDIFKYFFIDEYFNRQYQAERRFGKVFLCFSILAIFIATLGLFGLGSHMAMQKLREISVRKVLGANLTQALLIIPAKLLGLVLISSLFTLPLVYFAARHWLSTYAFKVDVGIWMFVIPLLVVLIVAILSIAAQSIRAALVNPADALRND